MAVEAVVAAVINKVVDIAASALLKAASRVYNLEDNISWIESEMRTLQSYLKDLESQKARNHEAANLIIKIRDLAQDVEDILDTYIPEIERHNTKGPFNFLKHASCIFCYCCTANCFGLEVEKIKESAAAIEDSLTNFGFRADTNEGATDDAEIWDRRKLFLHVRDSNVYGRKKPLQILKEKMLGGDMQCRVVSVVGQGGVGKTTVAKKIYQEIKNEFQSFAMVYVSKGPKVREVLLDIAKQVGVSEENLEDNLREFLEETRYILFLDDIWEQTSWDLLSNVLVTNSNNGSRIIVTSRDTGVGRCISDEGSLVCLDVLTKSERNEFFSYLMSRTSKQAPLQRVFKDIGEKIVAKCGGLPLAIKVAVGMLQARERSIDAWKQVLESINEGADDDCQEMLALSYQDLPIELKPLFLYFGIFPEDREIFVSELIRFWVAEKLLQVERSRKPHSIVEANIEKLIARNLIQVSKRGVDGRIRSCRIHDVLHNLCVRVAEEGNFYCTWKNLQSSEFASIVRRVTSNSSSLSGHQNVGVPKKLRALTWFSDDKEVLTFIRKSALDLKFLRFLIIEIFGDERVELPNEIGKLSSLIYLRLCGINLVIPHSIRSLEKLLTLEVMGSPYKDISVPSSILKKKVLKHLILKCVDVHAEPSKRPLYQPQGFEVSLPNVETLNFHDAKGYCLTSNSFRKLSNLIRLRTALTKKETIELVSRSASVLQQLESLRLELSFHGITSDMPKLDLSHYRNLVKLHLSFTDKARTMEVKRWVNFPPNLVRITFQLVSFEDDPMDFLKRLSKLEILKVKSGNAGKLDFRGRNSFPELLVLELRNVEFNELIVDEIGMPKLYKMIYEHFISQQLRKVPERLRKLMDEY